MPTLLGLSPSRDLIEKFKAAFPGDPVDVVDIRSLRLRPNQTAAQKEVLKDIEQLAIETVAE